MSSSELPAYAVRNRARWARANAEYTHEHGVRSWQAEEITWGLWGVPAVELNALPDVFFSDREWAKRWPWEELWRAQTR